MNDNKLGHFIILGIAAMLAGFGFSSLKMNFPTSTPMILEIVYLGITATAIGLELCAILNSACCSVFGKDIILLFFEILFALLKGILRIKLSFIKFKT